MKIEKRTNSEIRANKEKLVMENFASIMKKLDTTFLIESKEKNTDDMTSDELEDKGREMAAINNHAAADYYAQAAQDKRNEEKNNK